MYHLGYAYILVREFVKILGTIHHFRVGPTPAPATRPQVHGTVQAEGQKGREHAGGMVGFECQRMTVDDHGVNE